MCVKMNYQLRVKYVLFLRNSDTLDRETLNRVLLELSQSERTSLIKDFKEFTNCMAKLYRLYTHLN